MMFELSVETADEYLRSCGRVDVCESIVVRELAGGVSNMVLLVELTGRGERFVLKQARQRLRVQEEWLCPLERIWHECQTLRAYGAILDACQINADGAEIPRILWEDQANFAFAMVAAPPNHRTWKQMLLGGETEASQSLAVMCGQLLAQMHRGSWHDRDLPAALYDRTYFVQLRLDPYYRHIGRVHADLVPLIEQLIESVWQNRRCLVHGDFSPKNLLVWPGHVMLIDFEVGHYGDPAFDLGFFLTHLLLKSVWAGERGSEYRRVADLFWQTYRTEMLRSVAEEEVAELEQRMLLNLAGCMLARVDGKSPVDYLNEEQREVVRGVAREWLREPRGSWQAALTSV